MAKRLAVAVIHGMGDQEADFAVEMIDELNDRVGDLGKDPAEIAWQSIYWADILAQPQKDYLEKAKNNHDLDWVWLRKFVVNYLGDAAAYQKVTSPANTTYEKIHERVSQAINDLNGQLPGDDLPLIVLAHSLGGHIMSNHIWDMQHPGGTPPPGLSPFERMHTLAGMVTFGCNIPLFTFAYATVVPIEFPAAQLPNPGAVRDKAKWLNYYDPDDVLGYPLKSINAAYDAVVDEDIPISVGGWFSSWNPLSHNKYWTDNDFTKPAAEFIATFL
ncbi:MAG: hypothetical protein IH806_03295 [Proteobacteria bacterium]|nr:hypothetical protein [Pseudomonadota bacterium]